MKRTVATIMHKLYQHDVTCGRYAVFEEPAQKLERMEAFTTFFQPVEDKFQPLTFHSGRTAEPIFIFKTVIRRRI